MGTDFCCSLPCLHPSSLRERERQWPSPTNRLKNVFQQECCLVHHLFAMEPDSCPFSIHAFPPRHGASWQDKTTTQTTTTTTLLLQLLPTNDSTKGLVSSFLSPGYTNNINVCGTGIAHHHHHNQ